MKSYATPCHRQHVGFKLLSRFYTGSAASYHHASRLLHWDAQEIMAFFLGRTFGMARVHVPEIYDTENNLTVVIQVPRQDTTATTLVV